MARSMRSAGLLVWRRGEAGIDVLLGHPGGPLFSRRDDGAWSIPKGEYDDTENPWDAARREFAEELGLPAPQGEPVLLGEAQQRSGKVNTVWAVEGSVDLTGMVSNLFTMEWPPRSGRIGRFPELDRAGWFDPAAARVKLFSSQVVFIDRLEEHLAG